MDLGIQQQETVSIQAPGHLSHSELVPCRAMTQWVSGGSGGCLTIHPQTVR